MSRSGHLRAQELELSTELERLRHLRGVMTAEGASPVILDRLTAEIGRLQTNLDLSLGELDTRAH
jgi:hypothetical protein